MIYGRKFLFETSQQVEEVKESSLTFLESVLVEAMKDEYIATKISEILEENIEAEEDQTAEITDNEKANDTALENAIQEGANSQYTDFLKDLCKNYKENLKEARRKFKDKDYKEAKKLYQKAETVAKDIEKKIKSVKDDNVMTAIIGYFINYGMGLAQAAVVLATVYVPIIGATAAYTSTIETANNIKAWIKELKTEGINVKSLNLYRTRVIAFAHNLVEVAKLGQDACDAKLKNK